MTVIGNLTPSSPAVSTPQNLQGSALPPPPMIVSPPPPSHPTVEAETEESSAHTFAAFEKNRCINKVEVLSNRLVPGSDGSIEHVILANHQVTIIRSTPLKGRVRVSKDNVYVGGVSCKVLLTGLEARIETVRHLVGGDALVYGALFLSKERQTLLKKFGTITIGSPRTVIESLIEGHCAAVPSPRLKPLAAELDGMFLPFDKLLGPSAESSPDGGNWS